MDVLVCTMTACPWYAGGNVCKREVTVINESGGCDWIYHKNGQMRRNWQEKEVNKDDKS